jgi:hypothetical protein
MPAATRGPPNRARSASTLWTSRWVDGSSPWDWTELSPWKYAAAVSAGSPPARRGDDFARWLDSLPEEDQEISEQEDGAVQEAREETAAGVPLISLDDIKREFGHRST